MKNKTVLSEVAIHTVAIVIGIVAWRILKNILGLILVVVTGVAVNEFLQKRRKQRNG